MLPAPNLDDRHFQDLVDDAKRLVQQRCPEWTDHNVSDPGVTLIEAFAGMVDQLIYRLNRVPDRTHLAFLELLGLRLHPPTAAHGAVTFWLSAPQAEPVVVPAGTEAATVRTEADEAVVFLTDAALTIPPVERTKVVTQAAGDGEHKDRTSPLDLGKGFAAFSKTPLPGDALYVGLSGAAPSCAVLLRCDCSVEGVGVDPTNPPLRWEAWDGEAWVACELDRDETGGFNQPGDIVLHLPGTHSPSMLGRTRAGWVRARVLEADEGQPAYTDAPRINALTACTIGGTVDASHADVVHDEVVGLSEGVPGQRFDLHRRPVVGSRPVVVEVAAGAGWEEWVEVGSFAESRPADRHVMVDRALGQIWFGPAVRESDGTITSYGAVPPKAAPIRIRTYHHGGGQAGNVARGAISVLKQTLAGVARVENRAPAIGGVDAETVDAARDRSPVLLRTRDRAVTMEDHEHLAREAAPDAARVRCVPAGPDGEVGVVRVLVIPSVPDDPGRRGVVQFDQLVPPEELLERIAAHLEPRRCLGARIVVEPPVYQGVTIVARLRARASAAVTRVQEDALAALYLHFHPLRGGPDRNGWPFGRAVHLGEVYAVLQQVAGVEFVEDVRLFAADPITGDRGDQAQVIEVPPHALVFSFDHQLRVEQ